MSMIFRRYDKFNQRASGGDESFGLVRERREFRCLRS